MFKKSSTGNGRPRVAGQEQAVCRRVCVRVFGAKGAKMAEQIFIGADVFDGVRLHRDAALWVRDGRVLAIGAPPKGPDLAQAQVLSGGILAPGLIDLQVNGGGGVMLGQSPGVVEIARIIQAHGRLGTTSLLPTLITDTPEVTRAVLAAGIQAAHERLPGFLGLHLEGPHLDPVRKGAHAADLIRPMQPQDLAMLCDAAGQLPALMVTLAPEAVTAEQIAALAAAGVIVSLGHSDCSFETAQAAFGAGARGVTHVFNAMAPLGHRAPGLAGAALAAAVYAGVIADGVHVAPAVLRIAALAKRGAGLFLVSDAMAVAGTDLTEFTLAGRRILRRDGQLRLPDGTLAGADCDLCRAVAVMVAALDDPATGLETALAMATARPAAFIGQAAAGLGHLQPGGAADMVHLGADLSLKAVWRGGVLL